MKSPKLSKIAKSHLTYIAIVVAITAFAAGLVASARMDDLTASGPREVLVDKTDTIIYQNPDGTWPSPVPTSASVSGQSDSYDPIMEPDASGFATMGKLLYLFDGGSIQLPPDVYVEKFIDLGTCVNAPDCPVYPVVILARGDDRVAIDRYGAPFRTWSLSSESNSNHDAFEFLSE